MMGAIRTLIVDDMPPARRRLRRHLEQAEDFEIVGECGDGASAIGSIRSLRPDLVFLDVQMPEIDGFGVIAALEPSARPAIMFVTAHDEHALRAFEVHALDYLLKPFDSERFESALAAPRRGQDPRPHPRGQYRRDRLDRRRGKLPEPACRRRAASDPRNHERLRAAARPAALRAHPPLD